jgi:hypothetical protein
MEARARYDELCDDSVARYPGKEWGVVPAAHAAEWSRLAGQALSLRAGGR